MNSCKLTHLCCLLTALALTFALAACGEAAVDGAASTKEGAVSHAYATGDVITIEGEAPTKTTFAQTYARYAVTILRQSTPEPAFAEIGEQLSAAEVVRDAAVEAELDVSLTRTETDDMVNEVTRSVQSGDSPDMLEFSSASTAASLAAGGYLADLDTLGSLKLGNATLDSGLNAALTVAGRCYFLFGDATVSDRGVTAALLADVDAAGEAGIDLAGLLDTIHAGEWTTETLLQTAADGTMSLDGGAVLPLFIGTGGKLFVKDEQDVPTLTPGDSFSRAYAAMQTVMAAGSKAEENNTVFTVGTLDDLDEGLLALPLPAAEAGEPYRSSIDPAGAACVSVPASPTDPTRTGDILTAYFEQSTDTVSTTLYAHLDDLESAAGGNHALLDLILGARDCSLGALFGGETFPMRWSMRSA